MALYSLNDRMHFDHVIRIDENGKVAKPLEPTYAPEVIVELAEDDCGSITCEAEAAMIAHVESQGWELMTGYTGQYGYRGPIMHVSEYVGGQMETDIRATPGLYVVVGPTGLYATEKQEQEQGDDPIGWVVARKISQ
jgi:hypothetical protein